MSSDLDLIVSVPSNHDPVNIQIIALYCLVYLAAECLFQPLHNGFLVTFVRILRDRTNFHILVNAPADKQFDLNSTVLHTTIKS